MNIWAPKYRSTQSHLSDAQSKPIVKSLEILSGIITVALKKKCKNLKQTRRNIQYGTEIWVLSKNHKKLEPLVSIFTTFCNFLKYDPCAEEYTELTATCKQMLDVYDQPPRPRERTPLAP